MRLLLIGVGRLKSGPERELFDRGALVAAIGTVDAAAHALVRASGLIAIVTSETPHAIDARKLATHETIGLLERRGVLIGNKERLVEGEGI